MTTFKIIFASILKPGPELNQKYIHYIFHRLNQSRSLIVFYFPRKLDWLVVVVVFMLYMTLSDPVSEMELSLREDSKIARDFDLLGSSLISTFIEYSN